jgi:hypothetical protein
MRIERELVYVQTDAAPEVLCTREDITRQADQTGPSHSFFPMRKKLPYGRYDCDDGSYVFYNRDYEPILRIRSDGSYLVCDPKEWISHQSQSWIYSEANPPWRDRAVFDLCTSHLPLGLAMVSLN